MEMTFKEDFSNMLVPRRFTDVNMWNNGTVASTEVVPVGLRRWGVNNPSYRRIVRILGDATSSLQVEKYTMFAKAGLLSYKGRIGTDAEGQSCSTNAFPLANPWTAPKVDSWTIEQAQARAAVRVLGKIRNIQTSYSGFTILGEMHKTIYQLRHPFEALRTEMLVFQQKYHRTVRGKAFLTPSLRKAVSNTWLEFTLAVQPTLNDVFEILKAAKQVPFTKLHRVTGTGTSDSSEVSRGGYNCGGYMIWDYQDQSVHNVSSKFVCGVLERDETDRGPLDRAVKHGEFNLQGIIPAAWELLPWSFVIDYWSNIGHIMEAAAASSRGLSFSSRTTVSITDRKILDLKPDYRFDRGWYVEDQTSTPESYGRRTAIVRDATLPVVNNPIAAVKMRLPPHLKQVANMAALFDQRLCSKARFRFR